LLSQLAKQAGIDQELPMALQGPIPVEFGVVFPSGAYAAGAFDPVRNFEASTGEKFIQSCDKATGTPLWVIEVIDADPAARTRAVKVKVAAPEQPVVPARHRGHRSRRWSSPA
jgi:hypothetical protein